MIKQGQTLFLNLYAFSLTGGIEKVCRSFIKTLIEICQKRPMIISLHDKPNDIPSPVLEKTNYLALSGKKTALIINAFIRSFGVSNIILSHINLLPAAKIISLVKPKGRFILFAHGIEIWADLPRWKLDFLRKHVEIWAVSEYTRNILVDKHQIPENHIKVLNNCLAPDFNIPKYFEKPEQLLRKYQIAAQETILYTLTRLSSAEQYKGYDKVILALAQLKTEGYKFKYLIGGKADEAEKQRIEALIKNTGLQNEVILLGYIDDKDLVDHFILADVFIMPSRGEGFGIVFIEAAACGCQVIGGNADGSTDALLNGKLGQMIDPNSERAIKGAIEEILLNPKNNRIKQQELTIENFGFQQYIEKVKALL